MTDYEYILKQAKFFHYRGWEEGELRKSLDMLLGLTRQQLVTLYTSKWINGEKILKEDFLIMV